MQTIKLQQRGILTLPKKIREAFDLEEGRIFKVETKGNQIILEPQQTDFDAQLALDIKQGLEDMKNGRYIEFSTIEEFDEKMKNYED